MTDSIIINTYRRPETLRRCLEHLARQRGAGAFEVVVVDDGGGMDLRPSVAGVEGRLDVRLETIAHAGRSAARNRGVAVARGERILFIGDDVMLEPDAAARHFGEREAQVAVVGPCAWKNLRGSPPFRRWAEPTAAGRIANAEDAGFLFFATGNLSMAREKFIELGGFDEQFVLYGWEDIDLGLRFERQGGRLRYDAQAVGEHDHPGFTRTGLWRREYEMGESAALFWRKWHAAAPEAVAEMLFWDPQRLPTGGAAWRRWAAEMLIAACDRVAPASELNRRLYERMVFAQRYAGVRRVLGDAV